MRLSAAEVEMTQVSAADAANVSGPEWESAAKTLSCLLAQIAGKRVAADEPPWESSGPELILLAKSHRVASMLHAAPAYDRLDDQVRQRLERDRAATVMRNMTSLSRTAALLAALEDAGVPAVVLKGQSFAQFAYGDWSDRGISVDVDLLIPPGELLTAHRLFVEMGFTCLTDQSRRPPLTGVQGRYNRWLHYERAYRSPNWGAVDLHWRLLPGGASWTGFDSVYEHRHVVSAGGVDIAVPGAAHALGIAAHQAEIDGWPDLRCCVDVVMAWRVGSTADRQRARGMYPAVEDVVAEASQRIVGLRFGVTPAAKSGRGPVARQWRARTMSGSVLGAATRAFCGRYAPARRFSPRGP